MVYAINLNTNPKHICYDTNPMSNQLEANRKLLSAIYYILKKEEKTYNKTDIRNILKGERKKYEPKHDINISTGRLSGFLDALEVLGMVEANEKNLYSLTESAENKLKNFGFIVKSDEDV